jgi:hypothetical protein
MTSEIAQRITDLTNDALVYLTAATTDSILGALEESGIYSNREALIQFVALSVISSFTNKKATIRELEKPKFAQLRPFLAAKFMINNSVNNNALSQAGLCFLTSSAIRRLPVGQKWKEKFGKEHPWDSAPFSARVSNEQQKILNDKISRFSHDEARSFQQGVFRKAGLSEGSTTGS